MKKVPGIGSIFTAEEWKDEPYEVQESLKSDNLMKSIIFRKMELESHLDMKKRHIKIMRCRYIPIETTKRTIKCLWTC